MRKVKVCLWIAVLLLAAGAAYAQDYPTKPVRMIVPFAPGGASDVVARILSPGLIKELGQTIIVDNRGGASGNIGVEVAAQAPADGYTMLLGNIGTMAINPGLFPKFQRQPGARLCRGNPGGGCPHGARRPSVGPGEEREGVHRVRQGPPREAQFRHRRPRQQRSARNGDVHARSRYRPRPGPLQGRRRRGGHRTPRRRGPLRLSHARVGHAARQGGQDEGARRGGAPSHRDPPRCSVLSRDRL